MLLPDVEVNGNDVSSKRRGQKRRRGRAGYMISGAYVRGAEREAVKEALQGTTIPRRANIIINKYIITEIKQKGQEKYEKIYRSGTMQRIYCASHSKDRGQGTVRTCREICKEISWQGGSIMENKEKMYKDLILELLELTHEISALASVYTVLKELRGE